MEDHHSSSHLLQFPQLSGAHRQPPPDVDHDIGVSTVLRLEEGTLMLELLGSTVVMLRYAVGLAQLVLGLCDITGLLLGKQDVGSRTLGVQLYGLFGGLYPSLGVALSPCCLHQFIFRLAYVVTVILKIHQKAHSRWGGAQ